MSMGQDYVFEVQSPMGLVFIPRWYMSRENHEGVISKENS
jgi:hypothetical protein